jgi:hypothetical protein
VPCSLPSTAAIGSWTCGPSPAHYAVSVAVSRNLVTLRVEAGGCGRYVVTAAERDGDVLSLGEDVGQRFQMGDAHVVAP